MAAAPRISLVVPVYEEEDNLGPLIGEIREAMEAVAEPWELLLVDDGSRDRSWEIIAREAAADPRLRGLRFRHNAGQTAAFVAGFRAARGDLLVTLDADRQNDPADIPRLLEIQAREEADAVLGIRRHRHDSLLRRWASRIANAWRRWRTRDDTVDTGCSLKVFRRVFLVDLPRFHGMHRYLPTLARLAGAEHIVQVPVNHRPRVAGESKYGIWDRLWVGIADVRAVRWMQKRAIRYEVAEELPPAGGDA